MKFWWVKSHTGIEGKEVAENLANDATQDDANMDMVFDRIPFTSVASEISRKGLEIGRCNGTTRRKEQYVDISSQTWSRG